MHKKRNGVIPFFGKIIALTVMAFSVKNVTVKSVKIRQLLKFFYESIFLFNKEKSFLREKCLFYDRFFSDISFMPEMSVLACSVKKKIQRNQ